MQTTTIQDLDEDLINPAPADQPDHDPAMQACQIDPDRMQEEFVQLSGRLAYWGRRYGEVQVDLMRAELGLKKLKKRTYLELRAGKEKGQTETMLDAQVEVDGAVQIAEELVLQRTAAKLDLQTVVDAIRTKRDMLISLGAHQRAELKGDPMLRHAEDR
jgi:hypothetical protein